MSTMSQFYDEINIENATGCLVPATKEIALKFGALMSFLVAKNENSNEEAQYTSFYHSSIPSISLWDYGERLIDNLCVSLESYVLATTYVANLESIVTEHTAHRIMLAAVVVAAKNQDDRRPQMQYLSDVGGVDKPELVLMEEELLYLLGFRTYVDPIRYQKALSALDVAEKFQEAVDEAHQFVLNGNNALGQAEKTVLNSDHLPIDQTNFAHEKTDLLETAQTPPTPKTWRRVNGSSNTSMTSTTSTSSNFSSFGAVTSRLRGGVKFLSKRKATEMRSSKGLCETVTPKPNVVWVVE